MIGFLLLGLALAQDTGASESTVYPVSTSDETPAAMAPEPGDAVEPLEAPTSPEPPTPASREDSWALLGADGVFRQALAFQDEGRRAAALERLTWLDAHHPSPAVTFQIGKTLELDEDYAGALAAYDAVLAGDADADVVHNAAFRRAIVLEDLGLHQDSIQQIKQLADAGDWREDEAISLSLCQGIAELAAGRHRRGIQRIEGGLAVLSTGTAQPWMRARARAALVDHLLDEAASLSLKGNKKAARRLSQRNDLMIAAEQQIIAIAQLGQSEYILAGLLQLGDAYMLLHDDLLATTPPRSLDDVQVAIYQQTVAEKAAILRRKAKMYYEKGVQLADQVGWQGSVREALAARLEQV